MSLDKIRNEINEIDNKLVELLARRMELSLEVAKVKADPDAIYVPEREEVLLEHCINKLNGSDVSDEVVSLYKQVIKSSKKLQRNSLSPNKKIIFLDLDGTLLNDQKQVCDRNRRVIERCLEEGHKIIVTTGRPLESAIIGAKKLDLAKPGCYIASYNGGVLYDCTTNKKIFDVALKPEYTEYIFEAARKAGIHIQAYCGGTVWSEEDNEELRSYCKKGQLDYEIHKNVPQEIWEETRKVLLISFDEKKLNTFRKELEPWAIGKVQSIFSTKEYLEYSPLGISKGLAVETLAGMLGYSIEDTIAIGDERNDISMIVKAGLGVCMSNGLQSVKEVADYVTKDDNNHGGVAEVLEKYVLHI